MIFAAFGAPHGGVLGQLGSSPAERSMQSAA
jgi:hypothetical protein